MIDPHDMMCQEFVEVLTEYLDAMLGAHDRARLEAHLRVCDDCREYLAQFQQTVMVTGAPTAGRSRRRCARNSGACSAAARNGHPCVRAGGRALAGRG